MQKQPTLTLALVDYPGVQKSALWGLADLFSLIPRLEPELSEPQIDLVTAPELPSAPYTAFVFPPSLEQTRGTEKDPLALWAKAQHSAGALACSVCAGAFWLAAAGLLQGRPATTHWALEQEFQRRFPQVDLKAEEILIDDHDVITAGGLMAWLDLGLHLTGLWYGPSMVSKLSRHLLVDPAGRAQRHYSSFRPNRAHGDAAILRAQRHMDLHVASPLVSADLAQVAGMSLRSFTRHFDRATGYTPAAYLQSLRIEKARNRLEQSNASVAEIAWATGYTDLPAFSRAFKSITGLTPAAYRDRFRISAQRYKA
ncbi:GlxA family transcriptional regulator [Pseudophaeobacter sp. EL27]|uniref:GlxA family transcriptional regulator n=1 Tax=Pseudophaeobacter sp. EL27 TaxID=2107580 RepID=UPI000EFC28F8|nr:helix-turn-helix domain-containing protein [Pseudophaeobacter sp. EL27]